MEGRSLGVTQVGGMLEGRGGRCVVWPGPITPTISCIPDPARALRPTHPSGQQPGGRPAGAGAGARRAAGGGGAGPRPSAAALSISAGGSATCRGCRSWGAGSGAEREGRAAGSGGSGGSVCLGAGRPWEGHPPRALTKRTRPRAAWRGALRSGTPGLPGRSGCVRLPDRVRAPVSSLAGASEGLRGFGAPGNPERFCRDALPRRARSGSVQNPGVPGSGSRDTCAPCAGTWRGFERAPCTPAPGDCCGTGKGRPTRKLSVQREISGGGRLHLPFISTGCLPPVPRLHPAWGCWQRGLCRGGDSSPRPYGVGGEAGRNVGKVQARPGVRGVRWTSRLGLDWVSHYSGGGVPALRAHAK